ncbi:MAG TPA: dihydrofolate reductase family protein [Puia sp.]|nr:dihydrofolate reductase family protein [Puia sp.]
MRNLIYAINLTIDGCFDHTNMIAGEELLEYYTPLVGDADLLVYGRKTYELMVPYWPDIAKTPTDETEAEIQFARAFESVNKIVFSRTLDNAEGGNTRITGANLRDEILQLKQEEGRYILTGGVDIPSQLIALGLVDEYYFVIHPVLAGEGRRLFEGISLQEKLHLKLVESTVFKTGCIALHYLKH